MKKIVINQGDSIGFSLKQDSFLAYPKEVHKYFAEATDPFPAAKWYLKKVDSAYMLIARAGEYMYDTLIRGQNKPKYDNYKIADWEIAGRMGADTVIVRKHSKNDELKIYLDDVDALHRASPAERPAFGPEMGVAFILAGIVAAVFPFLSSDSSITLDDKMLCCLSGSLIGAMGVTILSFGLKEYDFDMADWRLTAIKNEVEKTNHEE